MRIYLACSVRGSRAGLAAARLVAERLAALGHEVLTAHLLADDVEGAEAELTEREVFERDMRWLDTCDALVAEASGSTFGVGYEVGYLVGRAPSTGQRVWLLFDASRRDSISRLVSGNSSPHCATVPYRRLDEVSAFVDRTFGSAPRAPDHGETARSPRKV